MENCFVTGNLSITSSESGGLIGRNYAMVTGCKVDAIGWVKGKEATGGLIGRNQGTIQKNTTNVDVESSNKVGGLIGINEGKVSLCVGEGKVLSDMGNAGGLIGTNTSTVERCYATGAVESNGVNSQYTGGLIGLNNGSKAVIENCFATGNVAGAKSVARLLNIIENSNSYKTTVLNCYSIGEAKGLEIKELPRNVRNTFLTVTECYEGATKELKDKMKYQSNFTNWDFNTIWSIKEMASYPYLKDMEMPRSAQVGKEQYQGSGTEGNPYLIETKEQLLDLGNHEDAYYALAQDINFEGAKVEPIQRKFGGTLDGKGYTIKNAYIQGADYYVGFFSNIQNGTIKNLEMENIKISGVTYGGAAGTIAGMATNTVIKNCSVIGGEVSGVTAGGLVGNMSGTIEGCSFKGSVLGSQYSGGFVGDFQTNGIIKDSSISGTVKATGSGHAGGFIGRSLSGGYIENCGA
ncbi:GLUG motif-containing protein, partial [Anaerotignum propionicum]|uniref:GLUG motif-containing protein n=1 Tax=Anaerotignum propionicum TaxID=28446 RepID=UPI002ED0EC50|nr:hypothetical protein [Anaerotignum propionicum]